MKRTLSFFLVMVMLVTGFTFPAVTAEETNISCSVDGDTLTISGSGAIPAYYRGDYDKDSIHHVIIEEGITEIGDRVFEFYYSLETVSLPDTLEHIGVSAFAVCRSLNNVTLPEGLKSIDDYAFYNCRSITEMVIPESVTYLGEHIFDYALGLSSVSLPSHLTVLPAATFHHCESLKEIELPSGITEMGDSTFSYSGIESIVIPKGVTLIPERAFEECLYLESVTLSDKIEKIDKYAFYHTPSLKGIDLPESLRVIEYAAFNRSGLEGELVIPEGVEEMYWKTFFDTDITKLSLPSTLTHMDYAIFGMTPLTEITVDEDNPVYTSYEGCLYSKDMTVLYMYTNGDGKEEVIIPATVEYLDGYSFGGNDIIKKIYLPFGIRTIHNEAIADRGYYAEPYPYYCYRGTPADDQLKYWFGEERVGYLEIEDISITEMPYRTEYSIAEKFKPLGLCFCVTDAFGEKSYFDSDFEIGEYDFSKEGKTNVSVSLWGYTLDVPVTVKPDVSPIPESMHPYESNFDRTWIYAHQYKCEYLRVSFSEDTFTERGYDIISIFDADGNLVGEYSGNDLAGVTVDIPGNSFSLHFVSDGSREEYGFSIDGIEAVGEVRKPDISIDNYTVTLTNAKDISAMRYASGVHTTAGSIKNDPDRVDISASVIAKNTVDGKFVYEMPDGGYYTFWMRMSDGTEYLLEADMTKFTPTVDTYGVKITVDGLYNVKDFFIAKGEFNSYNEIKNNKYIVRVTPTKIAGKHSYTYTVSEPGMHTVLVRYNDGSEYIFQEELVVDEPTFTANGLQVTIGNIPDVKVVRTAYGEYYTPGDTKRAEGARNFSNKSVIKDAESYMLQYREEGRVTIIVEYNNGYVKVFHYDVTQKTPTMEQNGNTVTFGDLDGLVMVRYAKGKFTTSSEIKKATGSQFKKSNAIDENGNIVISGLTSGRWSFMVQYNDESYNFYVLDIA